MPDGPTWLKPPRREEPPPELAFFDDHLAAEQAVCAAGVDLAHPVTYRTLQAGGVWVKRLHSGVYVQYLCTDGAWHMLPVLVATSVYEEVTGRPPPDGGPDKPPPRRRESVPKPAPQTRAIAKAA